MIIMQIVIEIPEEEYALCKKQWDTECLDTLMIAVKYGTPLDEVLDKIRSEIKTKCDSIPWRNNDYDDGWIEALEWVLDDVIDKYKAEIEE